MHIITEKKITYFVVFTFVSNVVLSISALLLYPPDLSKEFPVYDADGIMFIEYGGSLFMAGLTVMGIKLADEKKVLAAAGFTMFAIAGGILMFSLFEITNIVSMETYEKFYRIQASSNSLYLPAMYLIFQYEDFKKWVRYIGLISAVPLLISSFIFLAGNRNFNLLEVISNIGIALLLITQLCWAYNIYINYRKMKSFA